MDREQNLAWMAGFADGESCIHIGKCVNRRAGRETVSYQLTFHISQKTRESCARFKEFFGFGSLNVEFRKDKPYWYWRATGTDASEALKLLLPYMFTKRQEVENAIAFETYRQEQTRTRTKGKKGSGYSVEVKDLMNQFHIKSKMLNQSEYVN